MNDFFNRSYSVNDTTCAPETFLRGPGQKAISFLYFAMTPNATKVNRLRSKPVTKILLISAPSLVNVTIVKAIINCVTLILQIKPPGTHIDIINWQSQIANYLNQADADDEDVVEQVWSLLF